MPGCWELGVLNRRNLESSSAHSGHLAKCGCNVPPGGHKWTWPQPTHPESYGHKHEWSLFGKLRKGVLLKFSASVLYTLHSLCKWLFYLCQFNSLSLHCLLCLMLFCFLFFSIAVWWSLHHLYTHERALLSPEPCCLHWTIWGLLRPCTAFWGVSLQQPPLPASSGLPVLYLASRKASGNIRIKDWCWLSKW